MKLSVINSEKIVEFVPKISEYANIKKSKCGDFFANHPFHTNMKLANGQYPTKATH